MNLRGCSGVVWGLTVLGYVVAGVGPVAVGASAEPVSIDAVVRESLERNGELKFYEAEIAAALGERKQATSLSAPELNAAVGNKRVREAAGALAGEGVSWSVGLQQSFEWPGRIGLRKAIANKQVALARLGLAQFRRSLEKRVRERAWLLMAGQEKVRTAREVADRLEAVHEVVLQRDPAGVTPVLEQRILEAGLLVLLRRVSALEGEVREHQLDLNLWRGESLVNPLHLKRVTPTFVPLPALEDLEAAARTNHFELQQRAAELEQQGFRVDLARNERYPAISAGPFFSSETAGDRERVAGVGLSLPLPLWNRNSGNIEVAKARMEQAKASLEVARREADRALASAWLTHRVRMEEMSRWKPDSVARLREAAELADRHYRLGAVPVGTYVELQKQYLEGVEALVDTQVDAIVAVCELELVTGLDLGGGLVGTNKEVK